MNTKTAIGWGLWCLLCMPAFAAKTAIVIGNSNYVSSQDRLINPKNDAQAIAKRLDELGYDTQLILNADLEKMLAALNRLPRDPEGTVLFYYAGHGVQIDQRNYLVPVDARMDNRDMVERQTIAVREVLDKLHRTQAAQRVVILDACRNDPFPKAYRSGARGLSRESIPASKGQMILYAASADEVADDGRGQHGVFTQALLAQLQTPNLELPKLFDRVAEEVNRNTQGRQNPYTEGGQGLSSFVFYRAAAEETPKPPVVERVVERVVEKPVERIVEREKIVERDNPHAAEIAAWNSIKGSSRASDYQAYLSRYPSGLFAEAAQLKINQLTIPSQPAATPAKSMFGSAISAIFNPKTAPPKSDTELMAQGMWRDPKTKMIWMRCSLGQTWDGSTCTGEASKHTWQAAKDAVKAMNRNGGYGGYTDWVVPHIEDLASLIRCNTGFRSTDKIPAKRGGETTIQEDCKDGYQTPTVDQTIFPNTVAQRYWSASPYAGGNGNAWGVLFDLGYTHYNVKLNNYYVRAVRAGQ